MLVTNIGRAVLLGLLTVGLASGATSIWLLYVVAFLLGIGEAAYDNASQSLVPRLVPRVRPAAVSSTGAARAASGARSSGGGGVAAGPSGSTSGSGSCSTSPAG